MLTEKKYDHRIIFKEYETGYKDMFKEEIVMPLLDHLLVIFSSFQSKLFIGGITVAVGLLELGEKLFSSNEIWVYGISILVFLDFASGTLRAIMDPDIKFSLKKWSRTVFKITAYTISITAVIVASNMFPTAMGWLQYVTFVLLTATEVHSILQNLKLTALAEVLWDLMLSNGLQVKGWAELSEAVNKRSSEQFHKDQAKKFTRYKRSKGPEKTAAKK